MPTSREQWFADVLYAGLETHLLSEPDILSHATPAVLVESLPKDVVVLLLDATLASGTMSPQAIVETATPDILASHLPAPVIWGCITAAVERAGIPGDSPQPAEGAREFLRRALDQALAHGVTTAKDVVDDVNATVLGHNFPDALKTKLLEASLAAGRMNPELIIDTIGVDAIAKYTPTRILWACLERTGAPSVASERKTPNQPMAAQPPPASSPSSPSIPAPPSPSSSSPSWKLPLTPPPAEQPPASMSASGSISASASPSPTPAQAVALSPPKSAVELFDEDVASVFVELDESGTIEVSHGTTKEEPGRSTASGTIDERKRKTTGGHTIRRS